MIRRPVIAVGVAALLALSSASAAAAETTTRVIEGPVLRLESTADWDAASSLVPGVPVVWDVAVSAHAPSPDEIEVGLSAEGDAPLLVDVSSCAVPWAADACPSGARAIRAGWMIPRDGKRTAITTVSTEDVVHVRMSVSLASASPDATRLTLSAQSGDDTVSAGSDGSSAGSNGAAGSSGSNDGSGLATTGLSAARPWLLGGLAAASLLVGAALVRRRRDPDEPAS